MIIVRVLFGFSLAQKPMVLLQLLWGWPDDIFHLGVLILVLIDCV
jgi:hypothetical protein